MIKKILIICAFVALAACARNPVTGENELHLISQDQEVQMGEEQYPYMVQAQGGSYVLYPNVDSYVNAVGQKLARVSDRPDLPYDFTVINDSVPNAWALPGGKIAINRGLLVHLENEAELAAVLAHEIVHAAARHTAQQLEQGMLINIGIAGIAQSTQGTAPSGLLDMGGNLIQMNYSRSAESEADHYGMIYMQRAGYDPEAAVTLQELFMKFSGSSAFSAGLFASHPASAQRVEDNKKMAAQLEKGGFLGEEQYKRNIASVIEAEPAYEYLDKAFKAYSNKNYSEAIRYSDQGIAKLPIEAKFYIVRGAAKDRINQNDTAKQDYTKAISLDPTYYLGYLQRGMLYRETGQYKKAKSDLTASARLLPTSTAINALKAMPR